MENLSALQYVAIALLFAWSGFVRSGLGFGGAVLVLPFLLLIVNDLLVFLPLIAVHQILFGIWVPLRGRIQGTAGQHIGGADWAYLRRALPWILPLSLLGVLGLLTLPPRVMSAIVYLIVIAYALGYVFNRPVRSSTPASDSALLMLGGYFSGSSMIGGPLMVAVFASHVERERLRDTMIATWLILVSIKLVSFVAAGVDLQLMHHLWLLPCVLGGQFAGEKLHDWLLAADASRFYRALGLVLLLTCLVGLSSSLRLA
ncbi:MAG: TSUP family transporter [Azoarcus sp.]|nr:TSUP family transporter [Azoarcus sp.]